MNRIRVLSAFFVVLVLSSAGSAATHRSSITENVQAIQRIKMRLANEIDFKGSRVYVNQYALGDDIGIHAFEIRRGGRLKKLGMLHCPGITDTAALDDGLVAIGLQTGGDSCDDITPGVGGGVHIGDMKDAAHSKLQGSVPLPAGVHTLTRYPSKPLVYTSMGGTESDVRSGGLTFVLDASDPKKPQIAATYASPLNPGGCHDILFERIGGKTIGFCPGIGGTEIWDATDPLSPKPIGRMILPAAQLPHQVAVSSDGKVAAVTDEAWMGHACVGGAPIGAVWFYDITNLSAPQLLGFYGPQRGSLPVGYFSGNPNSCTAHNLNFVPGTRALVLSWIGGGTTVLDISDPLRPVELALYRPKNAVAMSSYWYKGYVYIADFKRGVEVVEVDIREQAGRDPIR